MYEDTKTKNRKSKQNFARKYFKEKYPKAKERKTNAEMILEITEQIRVCEELCCPLNESIIKDWIDSGNISYIRKSARKIKFA